MLLVLITTASFAQQITIHVETAGTLSSMIAESKKNAITDLKLTGHLNSRDMTFIREMRALENLDIEDAITYDQWNTRIGVIGSLQNMSSLKNIILPTNTTEIEYSAFKDCRSLEKIVFSKILEKIGQDAFSGCSNLQSLDLPNTLTTIGYGAFYYCRSLKAISIPNSVTTLEGPSSALSSHHGCFEDCSSLESIILPENITNIPIKFAHRCESLKSIIIPDEVHTIEDKAFNGCSSLKDVVIGRKVTLIREPFFSPIENIVFKCQEVKGSWVWNSEALKKVTFEKTVQSITSFSGYINLESIHIPSSVSSIGGSFTGCIELQSITVDENNPNYSSLNNALFNKDQTTLMTFANKSSDYFMIPETVTKIGSSAFNNCNNLKSLIIPASVKEIDYYAFSGCNKLEELYSYAITPPVCGKSSFDKIDKWLCTLYVPIGSYTAYWIAPEWGDFINIKEYDPTRVILNIEDMTLLVGETERLTAAVAHKNVTYPDVTWESDNEEIATVDINGVVTAISIGVANITATCNGVSATCKVTVNPVLASSVTLNVEDMTLLVGQAEKLTATVAPENTTNPDITWESDNEEVANVDANGVVTAVSMGVANITATCGNVSATCEVTVTLPSGMQSVTNSSIKREHYYSVDGKKLTSPTKGINLIKLNNRKVQKLFIK